MTTPILKIKAPPRTVIKGKMDVRFPASVSAESPIILEKIGGSFAFSFDMNKVIQSVTFAGFVSGPASAVDGNIPQFDGTTGKKLKDGKAAPTGDIVGTTDTQTLTNKTLTAPAISSPTGLVKADVGLGNVDNTSDATKNAATATLTHKTLTSPVINSPTGLVKVDVGLGNVDNTSDATKNAASAALTNKDLTSGTNTFPTFNQNTTGSAAKLTTARNIDGQAFDGSANITVIAPGTHAATSKTTPVDADELPLVDSAASNVLKKLTWANLKAALGSTFLTWAPVRERLTANRTYYVSTTGSDSNNGLSSGAPFLTVSKAWSVARSLDFNGFVVTIQLADGTYTGANFLLGNIVGDSQSVPLIIQGNNSNPGNVIISVTGGYPFFVGFGVRCSIRDMELRSTTSGDCIFATNGSVVSYQNLRFGACAGNHKQAAEGAVIQHTGSYAIVGDASAHEHSTNTGRIHNDQGATVTIIGARTFTNYFSGCGGGMSTYFSVTYSIGTSVTCPRYTVNRNGIIDVNGAGTSFLPGSSAGSTSTGGQYL